MSYLGHAYEDDSDADDEYEKSIMSPVNGKFDTSSPDGSHTNQLTPTSHGHEPSPKDSILSWSKQRCAEFVGGLGLDGYRDSFIDEEIDGEALVALQPQDLKDLGVGSVGHRLTILKTVYDIKMSQNVPMDSSHYVPPSAEANNPDARPTQEDFKRLVEQIHFRDDRLARVEAELHKFQEMLLKYQEDQRKVREEILPLARIVKEKSPLPVLTPDGFDQSNPLSPSPNITDPRKDLNKKTSKRNFFNTMKMPSPTIHENSNLEASAAAVMAANHLTASMTSSNQSPHLSSQPSPTSPSWATNNSTLVSRNSAAANNDSVNPSTQQQANTYRSREADRDVARISERDRDRDHPKQRSTPTTTAHPTNDSETKPSSSAAQANDAAMDASNNFMKSFRVGMDEPCHKVLPVALKKYNIADDWRQYSLYIVHGDTERCLELHEKPLILFKQLANEGKKPMFMLRKHAAPAGRFDGSSGGGLNGGGAGGTGSVRQSYASGVQLPGGVL